MPAASVVELGIVGFCKLETKPFGPVQEYEVAPDGEENKSKVIPAQIGPLFAAVAEQEQEGGALKVVVFIQVGVAEKTAVTVHVEPLEGSAVSV